MWSAWSTSRDNWERLMTAVVNREQMLQLFHAQSRSTPSTTTVSSHDRDADDICSQENIRYSEVNLESFSSPTPLVPQNQSVSQVGKDASSRPITRKLFTALYRMVKSKDKDSIDLLAKKGDVKRFSLGELKDATDNFSNRHFIGRGGFGKVYKGQLADGTLVAVKRHKHHKRSLGGDAQFRMEVEVRVSTAEHRNLLRLLGFCKTRKERLLVYPYMSNRSAALCLRDRDESELPLSWATRKRIASGVAKGLAYLHEGIRGKKIIHRDIKAANILLDDNFTAVIGDFGLTKIVQHNAAVEDIAVTENTLSYEELKAIEGDHLAKVMDSGDSLGIVTTALRGTIGHIAPEYLATGKASVKSDVFGYGIMLLELITGQRAFDLARLANDDDVMLLDWVKGLLEEDKLERLADSNMERNYVEREVKKLIQVALLCTQSSPVHRPKMSEVLTLLKGRGLAEKWNEWKNMEVIRQEVLVRDLNVEDSLDDFYTQE